MNKTNKLFYILLALSIFFQTCNNTLIEVDSIVLSPKIASVQIGDSLLLKTIFSPSASTNKEVTWSSSSNKIATVNSEGYVYGISVGEAIITVTTSSGKITATAEIKVILPIIPIVDFKISPDKLSLDYSDSLTASATISILIAPLDARPKLLNWNSSNPDVASINEDGLVIGLSSGTSTIRVSTIDEVHSVTCEIKVVGDDSVPLSGIELKPNSITIDVRDTKTLIVSYTPENTTQRGLIWTVTQDGKIIDLNGSTITGLSEGKATAIATSSDNKEISATCDIIVNSKIIPVKGITLESSILGIAVGQTSELVATVFPADASDKSLIWNSDRDDIVSVSMGEVRGISEGKAIITVSTKDGGFESTCEVTVNPIGTLATGVTIVPDKITVVTNGESNYITANIIPADASNREVIWTSSSSSIVTVTPSRNDMTISASIQGKTDGEAIVTVETADGRFKATCVVTSKTKINIPSIMLSSNSFASNGVIPIEYTREGANLSPMLQWEKPLGEIGKYVIALNVIALIEENATSSSVLFTYDVPSNSTTLLEQGDIPSYVGPNSPSDITSYSFKVYALKPLATFESSPTDSHEIMEFINQDNLLFISNAWVGKYTGN